MLVVSFRGTANQMPFIHFTTERQVTMHSRFHIDETAVLHFNFLKKDGVPIKYKIYY